MSEQQIEVSVEDQLLDAQMHVGRLENELALALKGIAPQLRWSTMRPAMSGFYLNTTDPEKGGLLLKFDQITQVCTHHYDPKTFVLGKYWAGPLQIGGPE